MNIIVTLPLGQSSLIPSYLALLGHQYVQRLLAIFWPWQAWHIAILVCQGNLGGRIRFWLRGLTG